MGDEGVVVAGDGEEDGRSWMVDGGFYGQIRFKKNRVLGDGDIHVIVRRCHPRDAFSGDQTMRMIVEKGLIPAKRLRE